jgi:DNA-binding GntR family transcriptional regulator
MSPSTDPVYLRVLEDLRMRIREGMLEPGARVPSRNAIIARYGVGETAAKHALQVLASEGLIEARAGSGSYVRRTMAGRHLEHERLHYPGSPFGLAGPPPAPASAAARPPPPAHRESWEHQTQHLVPPARIARRLGLAPGAPAIATRYLLTSDGEPVQLTISYEPPGLTDGTAIATPEQGPFAGRGVIERMRSIGIEVDQVVEELSVRPALLDEAGALAIAAGAAVMLVERAHLAGQQVVEAADIVIPADRFRLRYRFAPGASPAAAPPGPAALPGRLP